jgi:hypothetical protein
MRILVKLIYGKNRSVNGCNRRYIQYPWIKCINMQYPCFKCTEFTLGFSYEVQVVCLIFSFLYCELFVDQHVILNVVSPVLWFTASDCHWYVQTFLGSYFKSGAIMVVIMIIRGHCDHDHQGPSWLWSWSSGAIMIVIMIIRCHRGCDHDHQGPSWLWSWSSGAIVVVIMIIMGHLGCDHYHQGPSWLWSWSYGSKIYDYLCNRSVPISTKVVGSSPIHGEVYSIQYYVIKFVSNLR